jgi:hypothetical protein
MRNKGLLCFLRPYFSGQSDHALHPRRGAICCLVVFNMFEQSRSEILIVQGTRPHWTPNLQSRLMAADIRLGILHETPHHIHHIVVQPVVQHESCTEG